MTMRGRGPPNFREPQRKAQHGDPGQEGVAMWFFGLMGGLATVFTLSGPQLGILAEACPRRQKAEKQRCKPQGIMVGMGDQWFLPPGALVGGTRSGGVIAGKLGLGKKPPRIQWMFDRVTELLEAVG